MLFGTLDRIPVSAMGFQCITRAISDAVPIAQFGHKDPPLALTRLACPNYVKQPQIIDN